MFALHQQPNGQWKEVVLYAFNPNGEGGIDPMGGITLYEHGLYGITDAGGGIGCEGGGCGAIFELTRGSGKNVDEQMLWSFRGGAQGFNPLDKVVFDKRGDLFGVTGFGGEGCGGLGCGIVYGMREQKNGKWAYYVLHSFDGSDGVDPNSPLIIDSKGNLYGTTGGGGGPNSYGVAFELSPMTQASK